MSSELPALAGLPGLRPESTVQAWRQGTLRYQGVVEEAMPQAKVLWIREISLGTRKMIDLNDYVLRLC